MKKIVAISLGLAASFAIGLSVGHRVALATPKPPVVRENLTYVLEQLRRMRAPERNLQQLSLAEFRMGSRPDPSYLLFRYVAAVATPPELLAMLRDKSAAVRVVAAMAILKERRREMSPTSVDALLGDRERIVVVDGSCIPRDMSVGEVVAGLKKDPGFMDVPKAPRTLDE